MTIVSLDFDKDHFIKNLKRLFYTQHDDLKSIFHEVDYLVCVNSKEPELRMNKSTALMLWLSELNLSDTIIIFGNKCIYFVSDERNIHILETLLDKKTLLEIDSTISVTVQFFTIDNDEKSKFIFTEVVDVMKSKMKLGKIGIFKDEYCDLTFIKMWKEVLETSNFSLVDMSLHIAKAMSVKDEQEFECMKKASWYSQILITAALQVIGNLVDDAYNQQEVDDTNLPNNVVENINIPSSEMLIKNVDVAKQVAIKFMEELEDYEKESNVIKYCFPPIIQSNGIYNLNIHKTNDESWFSEDVIILCFGIRYKQYCSTVIKTYVVTPNKNVELENNFDLLQRAQKFIIDNLKDGVKLGTLYQDAVDFVKNESPNMVEHLTKNFGSIIGIEPEDKYFTIKENCKEVAKENMTFNINIGFHSVIDSNLMPKPPHKYSLWIGDCVKVEKEKPATFLSVMDNFDNLIMEKKRDINPSGSKTLDTSRHYQNIQN